jgi:NADPH:quinone reductase-like Zn-dependent oxidoreductase
MFSLKPNVTLTRGVIRQCRHRLPFSTSKAFSILSPSQTQTRIQAPRERTTQITNQLQRPYATMSNNKDLQLSEVFDVKGKVALVTGGGSGIGLMITQTLAVNGAKVYIVGRTEEKLEKVVEVHGKDIAGEIIPIVGNIATKDGVQ